MEERRLERKISASQSARLNEWSESIGFMRSSLRSLKAVDKEGGREGREEKSAGYGVIHYTAARGGDSSRSIGWGSCRWPGTVVSPEQGIYISGSYIFFFSIEQEGEERGRGRRD